MQELDAKLERNTKLEQQQAQEELELERLRREMGFLDDNDDEQTEIFYDVYNIEQEQEHHQEEEEEKRRQRMENVRLRREKEQEMEKERELDEDEEDEEDGGAAI
ncbi:hypothetical protein BZA77DRAFT_357326 [Pyronema omphalodes]|nr:hypothetical protein BZA77DRAFT_357326 [Pyronema omphalodes]